MSTLHEIPIDILLYRIFNAFYKDWAIQIHNSNYVTDSQFYFSQIRKKYNLKIKE